MRLPFRRQPDPEPEPEPEAEAVPEPSLPPGLEREIAVGSLSGVPPADIDAHVLLVVDHDGGLRITGVACNEMAIAMLSQAAVVISGRLLHGHAHGTEPS